MPLLHQTIYISTNTAPLLSDQNNQVYSWHAFWMIDRVGVESIGYDAPDWYDAASNYQSWLPRSSMQNLIQLHYQGQLPHFHKAFEKKSGPVSPHVLLNLWLSKTWSCFQKLITLPKHVFTSIHLNVCLSVCLFTTIINRKKWKYLHGIYCSHQRKSTLWSKLDRQI